MRFFICLICVASVLCFAPNGWKANSRSLLMKSENQISKALTAGLLSLSVLYGPVLTNIPTDFQIVSPANADFRAQQKRTYFRFIPKLEKGEEFYKNELKTAIDKEDWAVVTKFFESYVTKVNPNDPNQIDATDTFVNANFYRPLTVFSGSFAERGSSTKQRLLLEQKDAFAAAMDELEGCIKDRREPGLFGKEIKIPTGSARKQQALKAWNAGREAVNNYINIANDGLMLELNKITPI